MQCFETTGWSIGRTPVLWPAKLLVHYDINSWWQHAAFNQEHYHHRA